MSDELLNNKVLTEAAVLRWASDEIVRLCKDMSGNLRADPPLDMIPQEAVRRFRSEIETVKLVYYLIKWELKL